MSHSRRSFLGIAVGSVAFCESAHRVAPGEDRPRVTEPRATSGDEAVEPEWTERLTITVGNRDADLCGNSERTIQAAVDYAARLGGGTVKLLPGTYKFRNAVYLRSRVKLIGSGEESVCIKEPSRKTRLAQDSDWYDQEITLQEADGFQVGDGVCLRTRNPHNGGQDVVKRTLVARSGQRFKLDRALRNNFWTQGESTVATLFPLLSGDEISDVVIENLVLDGNRTNNENLDGNYAGCIFLQDCNRVAMRSVTARNYNGDGFSWQICHDVVVENCHSHGHAGLGLHPGSGSQRPVMRNNRLRDNNIGIFFCWGVKYGLAEGNLLEGNKCGISVGHRDTDNRIAQNIVRNSTDVGILFRPERGKAFAPHRNRVEGNTLENNGVQRSGIAVDIQGETEDIAVVRNTIRDDRPAEQRIGIRVGPATRGIQIAENSIRGMMIEVQDQRQP
jgi:hypothetical protein